MLQLTLWTKLTASASTHARQQKQINNTQYVMLGDTEKHSVLTVSLFPPYIFLLVLFIDVNMNKQATVGVFFVCVLWHLIDWKSSEIIIPLFNSQENKIFPSNHHKP